MNQRRVRTFHYLIQRLKFWRLVRFSSVGLSGVLVNQGLLWALTTYVFGERFYLLAAVFSVEASVINNFYWNDIWTFGDRQVKDGWLKRLIKFHGSRFLGIITSLVVLFILTDILGMYYLLSNLFSIGAGTVVNYLTSDYWVWSER